MKRHISGIGLTAPKRMNGSDGIDKMQALLAWDSAETVNRVILICKLSNVGNNCVISW